MSIQTTPNRLRIFKSSAGSGKTFTLVRSYLGIVLREPDNYRHVLAITFTNKATGEMKERIVREIFDIAQDRTTPMLQAIQEDSQLPESTLRQNASRVLSSILHDYANFAVQTIDSFTYKLLRNFARDLDLPSRFDVELDTASLLRRMMDQLMDKIGQDPYVTDILIRFAEEKLRTESGWQVDAEVVSVAGELFSERSKGPIERIHRLSQGEMSAFIDLIRNRKEQYPVAVVAMTKEILEKVRSAGISFNEFLGGQYSVMNALAKLHEKTSPGDFQSVLEGSKMTQALEEDKWVSKSGPAAGKIEALLQDGLRQRVAGLLDYHDAEYKNFLTAHYAYANIHSLAVLRQVEELLDEHKAQNAVLHISDFHKKLSDFISTEAPEYIFWRMGDRYKHFLFDEFQDTSVLQWHNLFPLFENVGQDPNQDGSLMLVGDAKQAIYRWRGGESELIDLIVPAQLGIEPEVLGTNYRSLEYVVDFNNTFFESAMEVLGQNEKVQRTFADVRQGVKPGNEGGGLVQVHTFLKPKRKEEFVEQSLERLLEELRKLREIGYNYSDICVLVRTSDEGSKVAKHLDSNDIRVISSDSLLLAKEPVINFMLSLFRFLNDPLYGINRAEVLHYFLNYLQDGADSDMDRNEQVRQLLLNPNPVKALFDLMPEPFQKMRFKLDQLPLYELMEETIRIFGLRAKAPAYVQQFLDLVLEYAERRKPDLPGFLAWWDEKKDSFAISMPKGQDAVEIMTIHKSKGLQFPVVFLPFASWDIHPKRDSTFWATAEGGFEGFPDTFLVPPTQGLEDTAFAADYEDELKRSILDNLNLLYVAFTRPEDRLYVYTTEDKPKSLPATLRELNNLSKLIHLTCEGAGMIAADGFTFETGMPTVPKQRKKTVGSRVMEDLISEPWRERVRIERKVRRFWENGVGEGDSSVTDSTIMREILGQIQGKEDIGFAVFSKMEEGLVSQPQADRVVETLNALLSREPFADWYGASQSMPLPLEIVSPKGLLASPDRVIRNEKAFTCLYFVDEKQSGQFDAEKAKLYASALIGMGFGPINVYLVVLPSGELNPIGISG